MQRWFRALVLACVWFAALSVGYSLPTKDVSGRIAATDVRIFVKDTLYRISGTYVVSGALVIEPGTTVEFLPNGRLIDSVGGRIIADGQLSASYNNPFVPNQTPNPNTPGFNYTGYADMDYFANSFVTTAPNVSEPTINIGKAQNIFWVNLSSTDSRLQNMTIGKAIIYKASRIETVNSDPNLNQRSWTRIGGKPVDVVPSRITFQGNSVNAFSREWGHIVILPGANVAYFRNVDFNNFRKDTTVDRIGASSNYYSAPTPGSQASYDGMNKRISSMTSGSGGALTSFSSRTWLVGCAFANNMARYHGGAVQLLQAPLDDFGANGAPAVYPDVSSIASSLSYYPVGTNVNVTDPATGLEINQQIPMVDNLSSPAVEPFTDANRQLVDDARLAVYLGRVREITFRNNNILLSNIRSKTNGGGAIVGVEDDVYNSATVDPTYDWKNEAFGGALYIAGRSLMEIGLGNNDGFATTKDYFVFEGNTVTNLQPVTPTSTGKVTRGARGGAVYVGDATSVIFSGRFASNETRLISPQMTTAPNPNGADYSQGGALYVSANSPRVQIRGGQTLITGREMRFENNKAGRGGAIYAFVLTPTNSVNLRPSPVIGGSDATINTRNYGYGVKFLNNSAVYDGGGIYAEKRISINGAGGTVGTSVNYDSDYRVEFTGNTAGFSGGAVSVNLFGNPADEDRRISIVRTLFSGNSVGSVLDNMKAQVRGGGAVYLYNTQVAQIKGVEFLNNIANNGNGGAVAVISPGSRLNGYFATDLDAVTDKITSNNAPYTYGTTVAPDVRSLTRFLGNQAIENTNQMGSGTTQINDVTRLHPGTSLMENGTGLGGAVYILDQTNVGRNDRYEFNRVRFQDNKAYSGAVVYSDNYDLKIVLQRSLLTGNIATSGVGVTQNSIAGPFVSGQNPASSDLAGAIMYGEILGPLPFASYPVAANAIYDNQARFLIRLPDAPNTKGSRAGSGVGFGGVDTLRGNYWGRTEADVNTLLTSTQSVQETFFIGGDGTSQLPFVRGGSGKNQGPFESVQLYKNGNYVYQYTEIPVSDDFTQSIPEKLLQQGVVYDIFDKGTDIKTADYSNRRMSRIEDFAVGIPPALRYYTEQNVPSFGKVVKRWLRDPFQAENDATVQALQGEFIGDHPIGYPLFLETHADYSGDVNRNNNDNRTIDETVFFVVNENTGDFIRVNMQQVSKTSETYRARVEFVADSANRVSNPLERRTSEGLANFGSGGTLLDNLRNNPLNEDMASLKGRKYENAAASLGGGGFGFSNRDASGNNAMPPSTNNGANVTYFAGEKYRALPVRSGDRIRVISRTILWSKTTNEAIVRGLDFYVSTSTKPPIFTGNKLTLENISIPEWQNTIFVQEDVIYPHNKADVRGRDSIFSITAKDTNKFYDPRSIMYPTKYTQLEYKWTLADTSNSSGLKQWLKADTIYNNSVPYYNASGYITLKGQPHNPYIIPGGEWVTVTARNWPPQRSTIDSLKAIKAPDSVIAKYIYIYPPYFNAQVYDATNARYLQQDTVDVGGTSGIGGASGSGNTSSYSFKIVVIDSIPVFTNAVTKCVAGDTLIASVTDSLRFDLDINTDDESEDLAAFVANGWDFKYGRTAYAFQSVSLRGTTAGDTTTDGIQSIRPTWLNNQYLVNASGKPTAQALADFTTYGILKSRVDYNTVVKFVKPKLQINRYLNADTVIAVVVNDGHGGLNTYNKRVLLNFAPTIETTILEAAIEDQEYNQGLIDSNRMIKGFDQNFGQSLTYQLIYSSTKGIVKDPCYSEAGNWDIVTSTAKTPTWLHIDPISGRLFGIPHVLDAPRMNPTPEYVTVVVTDPYGLTYAKTIPLEVKMVNHNPKLVTVPPIVCVDLGQNYLSDTLKVTDIDLKRAIPVSANEKLTFTVEPTGFSAVPATISGPLSDTVTFKIQGIVTATTPRNPDGTVTVKVTVSDKLGLTDVLTYRIAVSEKTDFISDILVQNSKTSWQILKWGTGSNSTTGEDAGLGGIGKLDSNYCEFELPPIPPRDVFDARWSISNTNGIQRNIIPKSSNRPINAIFQAGGVTGNDPDNYPVLISWNKLADATRPATGMDYFMQDQSSNGNIFKVNMRTGVYRSVPNIDVTQAAPDLVVVHISSNVKLTGFQIVKDSTSKVIDDVQDGISGSSFVLSQNMPNPFSDNTTFEFGVPQSVNVSINIYDAIGNKVATLVNGYYEQGSYKVNWDGKSVNGIEMPSGIYTYRMTAGTFSSAQKMIIVK